MSDRRPWSRHSGRKDREGMERCQIDCRRLARGPPGVSWRLQYAYCATAVSCSLNIPANGTGCLRSLMHTLETGGVFAAKGWTEPPGGRDYDAWSRRISGPSRQRRPALMARRLCAAFMKLASILRLVGLIGATCSDGATEFVRGDSHRGGITSLGSVRFADQCIFSPRCRPRPRESHGWQLYFLLAVSSGCHGEGLFQGFQRG